MTGKRTHTGVVVLWVALVATSFLDAKRGRAEPPGAEMPTALPRFDLPDPRIAEVYEGNWRHTLLPCRTDPAPSGTGPHVEPARPWKVDVGGHYPGWYPGVDVKHLAAAYLACAGDLPLVLKAWDLTSREYQMPDGGIQPSTMKNNPQGVWPETNDDRSIVFYPLRTTATIDYLLLADLIFRYSQDRRWLAEQLPSLRRAAAFLEGWTDPNGLLHSDSYDLDQVYREIDGVAQASACLALGRLADLESVSGTPDGAQRARELADRLRAAAALFWDPDAGFYAEHLVYNNVARLPGQPVAVTASSDLDAEHAARKAVDGVTGIGVDAFQVGLGAAGRHEWAARGETRGAWLLLEFAEPVAVSGAVLINRTDRAVGPGERFAGGQLEFSDGSPPVPVEFQRLGISRAAVLFPARRVSWVRFRGGDMQGAGDGNAGLAEFLVLAGDVPYRKISHGMTDTNLAFLGFGVADPARGDRVWEEFRRREPGFYQVGEHRAPTWISTQADSYQPRDLNRRAPRKDCVAMGRTWRYDALMRRRNHDGVGLYQTIRDAIVLYDRPSGGGVGLFSERYGLGKFQPGDESQANVAAYAEYPAVFASTVVQECLCGLSVDVHGTITIDPCVPRGWYDQGFAAEGCHVLAGHTLGFSYQAEAVRGRLAGPPGARSLLVRLPPALAGQALSVKVNGAEVQPVVEDGLCRLALSLEADAETVVEIGRESR